MEPSNLGYMDGMADRYDPKVTVRPATDRKGPDTQQGPAASDDPLFELARIVSGRGAGGASAPAAAPSRGRPAPAPEPARPTAPEPDILGDLEAELLSDLQASFAAVKEAIEPGGPAPKPPSAPSPAATPPAAAAAPPPHVTPEPPVAPARPPQAEALPPLQPAPSSSSQPYVPPQPAATQAPPPRVSAAARPPIHEAPPRPPIHETPPRPPAAAHPPIHEAPPRQPAPPAPADPKPAEEVANFNLRPTAAPHVRVNPAPPAAADKTAPSAAKSSRWDKPAEPPKAQASAASRFAPPRAANQPAAPAPAQPGAADEAEPPFGEGLPFAHDGQEGAEEFPLDAFDIVPGYGDDVEEPPYPEDDLEPLRRRGVPRSLVVVAGILAIALIGVLGYVMLRSGTSGGGTPPIISADAGPTKIAPPEPPAASDSSEQNKLIYDRVDSGASGAGDTKLVTQGNAPLEVPSTGTDNAISRVILPGGPGTDASGAADVAANEGDAQSIGPRKVRTVVVRPDGTIVSSEAAPAEGDAPASVDAAPTAPATTAEVPAVPPVPTNDDTAAIAGGTSGQELKITPNPTESPTVTPSPPAPAAKAPVVAKAPTPTPTPTPKPKVVATGGDGGPIDLTPGSGGASTNRVASAGAGASSGALALAAGGRMVQVSSQRSEDAARATFRDLQARYPSILGGYNSDIQRVDLGSRGTYYRVRVGPFASADAQNLCSQLKNAGGDCILAAR